MDFPASFDCGGWASQDSNKNMETWSNCDRKPSRGSTWSASPCGTWLSGVATAGEANTRARRDHQIEAFSWSHSNGRTPYNFSVQISGAPGNSPSQFQNAQQLLHGLLLVLRGSFPQDLNSKNEPKAVPICPLKSQSNPAAAGLWP